MRIPREKNETCQKHSIEYISSTLDWFWKPRLNFWARTRSSFFAEVISHTHPAYASLHSPRDRVSYQPILLWNCYVTANTFCSRSRSYAICKMRARPFAWGCAHASPF